MARMKLNLGTTGSCSREEIGDIFKNAFRKTGLNIEDLISKGYFEVLDDGRLKIKTMSRIMKGLQKIIKAAKWG